MDDTTSIFTDVTTLDSQPSLPAQQLQPSHRNKFFYVGGVFLLLVMVIVVMFGLASFAPVHLSQEVLITIPEGYSVRQTSRVLAEHGVVTSQYGFELFARIFDREVHAGRYQFTAGIHILATVSQRLSESDYGDAYVNITIPEGSTRHDIASILEKSELAISKELFMNASNGKEGYLFPDTYYFVPGDTVATVLAKLQSTFDDKITKLELDISNSPHNLNEILTMASLIEREASSDEQEMKIISGILWKRIAKGMPLQVDAPFMFLLGKTSSQLTLADLAIDSPYNTYVHTGLPPSPIGNPGIRAIEAALYPIDNSYFFYLHGSQGGVHYAKNFEEHKANKQAYLK